MVSIDAAAPWLLDGEREGGFAPILPLPKEGEPRIADSVIAFGVFDGLHEGHRSLVEGALADARARGASVGILTFDIDPDELLNPNGVKKLMGNSVRIRALSQCGVDFVSVLEFNRHLASLDPVEFLDAAFASRSPAAIHVGANFRFGCKAAGDVGLLAKWGEASGTAIEVSPLLDIQGQRVSSTRIRSLLQDGEIGQANELLGHLYEIEGRIVHGAKVGASLGFRTANLTIPDDRMVLADGVYAAYADVDGVRCKSAVSVGLPPTFEGERTANVEAHILDFEGDIYGKELSLRFVERLRPLIRFDSLDELKRTVERNFQEVRDIL